jgi:hypothetical protein
MHLSLNETALLPREYRRANEYERSDLQASNGEPLYAVAGAPGHVALGDWSCSLAGEAAYLTSLRKLGWSGRDLAVYVDRTKRPEGEGEVDFFNVGGVGHLVANEQGVPLRVFMPEKMFTAPSSPNVQTARVIYAACDEDGVGYILENLRTDPLIGGIRGLEDFWTIGGKIWVMAHGPRASIQEPVERVVRIYGFDGRVEHEARMSCVACGRPVLSDGKFIFPIQRMANGAWELTTGDECLWKGYGISNLFALKNGVHCLVSDRFGEWSKMKGKEIFPYVNFGQPKGDVTIWQGGVMLFVMSFRGEDYAVYDDPLDINRFSEINHRLLVLHKGVPVYPARVKRGGKWHLTMRDQVGEPCDKILEIESVPNGEDLLRVCFIKGGQILNQHHKL